MNKSESFGPDCCVANAFNWMGYGIFTNIFLSLKIAGQRDTLHKNQRGESTIWSNALALTLHLIEQTLFDIEVKRKIAGMTGRITGIRQHIPVKSEDLYTWEPFDSKYKLPMPHNEYFEIFGDFVSAYYAVEGLHVMNKQHLVTRGIKQIIPQGHAAFLHCTWHDETKLYDSDNAHIVCIMKDLGGKLNIIELQECEPIIKEEDIKGETFLHEGKELQKTTIHKYFEAMDNCYIIIGALKLSAPVGTFLQKSTTAPKRPQAQGTPIPISVLRRSERHKVTQEPTPEELKSMRETEVATFGTELKKYIENPEILQQKAKRIDELHKLKFNRQLPRNAKLTEKLEKKINKIREKRIAKATEAEAEEGEAEAEVGEAEAEAAEVEAEAEVGGHTESRYTRIANIVKNAFRNFFSLG